MRRLLSLTLPLAAAALCAAALAPASAGAFQMFRTPSGNIGCMLSPTGARCDVANHSWRAPPKPRGCGLDWGNGMMVSGNGRGRFVCAGDTVLGGSAVLAYGRTRRAGRFACTSRESGITCRNSRTRHGFMVSRTRASAF